MQCIAIVACIHMHAAPQPSWDLGCTLQQGLRRNCNRIISHEQKAVVMAVGQTHISICIGPSIGILPHWDVNAGAAGWPIRDLGDPQLPPVHCQALPAII